MYTKEELLGMIASDDPEERWDACMRLKDSEETSPEIVRALEKATHDEDIGVAERARQALQANIHYQEAIYLGLIKQDNKDGRLFPKTSPIETQAVINSTEQIAILNKLVNTQIEQNELLNDLNSGLKFIVLWLILILIAIGISASLIYQRMGQMRIY